MSSTLTHRRLIEMFFGRDALAHRIGANDSFSIDQLPDPAMLASSPKLAKVEADFFRCGVALAESFLKLVRPCGDETSGSPPEGDAIDLWSFLSRFTNDDMRMGFLSHIELFLQFALIRQDSLQIIGDRLGILDNVALQENLTRALCGEPVGVDEDGYPCFFGDNGGLFKGLL